MSALSDALSSGSVRIDPGVDMSWDDGTCHCGKPVAYGFDGDPTRHRGMCEHCDSVRCDAYPGECKL